MRRSFASRTSAPNPALEVASFPREKLAVDPCRTAGTHLLLDRQVGAGGEGQSLAAGGIVVRACLYNRTRPGVACQLQIGEAEMVGTPINAFHDGISRTLQLVV